MFLLLLAAGVLATAGILAFRGSSDEAEPAAQASTQQGVPDSRSRTSAQRLAQSLAADQSWEGTVEALAGVERHLNRTKLTFDEIDALLDKAVHEGPPPGSAQPGTAPRGGQLRRVGNLHEHHQGLEAGGPGPAGGGAKLPDKPPPGVEWVRSGAAKNYVPESQDRALSLWSEWRREWPIELEAVRGLLPGEEVVEPKLRSGYDAVLGLLEACTEMPEGNPPSREARSSWLASRLAQLEQARETVNAAR